MFVFCVAVSIILLVFVTVAYEVGVKHGIQDQKEIESRRAVRYQVTVFRDGIPWVAVGIYNAEKVANSWVRQFEACIEKIRPVAERNGIGPSLAARAFPIYDDVDEWDYHMFLQPKPEPADVLDLCRAGDLWEIAKRGRSLMTGSSQTLESVPH